MLNYLGTVQTLPDTANIGDACIKNDIIYIYRDSTWTPLYTMSFEPIYMWKKPEEKYFSAEEFII